MDMKTKKVIRSLFSSAIITQVWLAQMTRSRSASQSIHRFPERCQPEFEFGFNSLVELQMQEAMCQRRGAPSRSSPSLTFGLLNRPRRKSVTCASTRVLYDRRSICIINGTGHPLAQVSEC